MRPWTFVYRPAAGKPPRLGVRFMLDAWKARPPRQTLEVDARHHVRLDVDDARGHQLNGHSRDGLELCDQVVRRGDEAVEAFGATQHSARRFDLGIGNGVPGDDDIEVARVRLSNRRVDTETRGRACDDQDANAMNPQLGFEIRAVKAARPVLLNDVVLGADVWL